ncbi:DUF4835 family protein [Plebeiibacterium sediminum]|uniref:DUF4835 family protein n=1 Tax=Plebeiibacterium sediminum TaxID=2992112 RepID=A0AAE3SGF6_9BACT|nr:DUF4835 family protein [Plebeiobacterium sediminum]MCW3787248.1 DUF4835 family protein [Plebeiobacterium sediminum]
MKKFLFLILFLISVVANAQELQCSVSVVSPSVQGTNKQVYETMQTAIMEFVNGQKWTDNIFSPEERIECSILINIKEVISSNEFSGTIQVQARRPVYNSSYRSMLFNYLDQEFKFKYEEFEPLVYNPNSISSNLVGVISYYAYVILGLDYDSFAKNGGTKYMEQAEKIVSMSQNSRYAGWRSYESKTNRYWFVENYLNEVHRPMRDCIYQYHRLGLDKMSEKPEDGRKQVLSAIEKLTKVHRQRPGTFAMELFFDAKSDELVNIFSESFSMERQRAIEVLTEVDPANSSKYSEKLTQKQ